MSRRFPITILSFVVLATLAGCASFPGSKPKPKPKPVVFTAMGCGPYNVEAEEALAQFIRIDNELATSAFMVHCGDVVTGANKNWPESQYNKVAKILHQGNRIPTFVVPGDNEWNDQEDPDLGWEKWTKYFSRFDTNWEPPVKVTRQEHRQENFAFVLDRVLFIGINKVGGRVHDATEWDQRLGDNAEWIAANLAINRNRVHSAAIFAQATAEGNTDILVRGLRTSAAAFGKPILYLHADGHKWYVRKGDWAQNITHVQMDLISSNFPPIQVTATGDAVRPWVFDRRQNDATWGTAE